MLDLGDEIIYKKIKGVVIDVENQIVFNGQDKFYVILSESTYVDSLFDDLDDLEIYLSFISEIEEKIIDIR